MKKRRRIQPPSSSGPPRVFVRDSYLLDPDTGEIIERNLFDPSIPMTNPDDIERTWFRFSLPITKRTGDPVIFVEAFVPADTEDDARTILARNCYDGAPVASWPVLGTVQRTRASFIPGR